MWRTVAALLATVAGLITAHLLADIHNGKPQQSNNIFRPDVDPIRSHQIRLCEAALEKVKPSRNMRVDRQSQHALCSELRCRALVQTAYSPPPVTDPRDVGDFKANSLYEQLWFVLCDPFPYDNMTRCVLT